MCEYPEETHSDNTETLQPSRGMKVELDFVQNKSFYEMSQSGTHTADINKLKLPSKGTIETVWSSGFTLKNTTKWLIVLLISREVNDYVNFCVCSTFQSQTKEQENRLQLSCYFKNIGEFQHSHMGSYPEHGDAVWQYHKSIIMRLLGSGWSTSTLDCM